MIRNIVIGDKLYPVLHQFSEERVLIKYDGLVVFANQPRGSATWELDGEPAREDEKPVLEALIAENGGFDTTSVVVTPPEE